MANNLIGKIEERGYSLDSIAGELVITKEELVKKINREIDFLYSEICYLRNLLNLSAKEVDFFFFDDGQAEFDSEIEQQNERRNYLIISNLKAALDKINTNNTQLVAILDVISRCDDEGMKFDSISMHDIALSLARQNDCIVDEAERECYEAF